LDTRRRSVSFKEIPSEPGNRHQKGSGMAILTMFEIHGDPDELISKMESAVSGDEVQEMASRHGGISNTVVRTDRGIMVVNHWESEEGMEAMAAEMRPKVEGQGVGPQVDWRKYEILRYRPSDA
jgi:hypothetical protein